jgi:hypothetical protein
MTIQEAAEKIFDFTESINESGNHTMELDLGGGCAAYFEAEFDIDWKETPATHISPAEHDRVYCGLSKCILAVNDDDGDIVEGATAELQEEFCKWFGKVIFEEN